ncbi:DUF485 domain-containing protein [Methylobacterium terricola]|uniref:DUF485 domain-containing protein n=1 Tax=Methylobacterium terricola TaxID=2583531 RepID=A0A5C4LIB1_9HYPH|nr:DUF485 domain-containing protein [Methylobacterium terricola]TNC11750.1 DUF485 domain-containing protein [Methylobacterium terricola]
MAEADTARVLASPTFRQLVTERTRYGWILSGAMLGIYLGFILLVAFAKGVMAAKIGSGVTSLGIVLGLVVIVSAFALTGIYVARANGRYDDLTNDLNRELGR